MKKHLILIIIVVLSIFLTSCENEKYIVHDESISTGVLYKTEEDEENNNSHKAKGGPSTITDLFDGEQRVWFYLSNNDLAYDSYVRAVLVTKNKNVTDFYYNLKEEDIGSGIAFGTVNGVYPNAFSREQFTLSDFDNLSFSEIIETVSQSYADASIDYSHTYDYVNRTDTFSLSAVDMPYKIIYNGDLDNSGNNLEGETLSFIQDILKVDFGSGNYRHRANINCKYFCFDSIIRPTQIKSKEYVGIKDDRGFMLVTENNFVSFENIRLDSPENVTEW